MFRTSDGGAVGKPLAHTGRVERVEFRPDGRALLMAGGSRSADTGLFERPGPGPARREVLRLWDQAVGQQLAPGNQIALGRVVVYSPDGRLALVVTRERTVLWDVTAWRAVGPVRCLRPDRFISVCSVSNTSLERLRAYRCGWSARARAMYAPANTASRRFQFACLGRRQYRVRERRLTRLRQQAGGELNHQPETMGLVFCSRPL